MDRCLRSSSLKGRGAPSTAEVLSVQNPRRLLLRSTKMNEPSSSSSFQKKRKATRSKTTKSKRNCPAPTADLAIETSQDLPPPPNEEKLEEEEDLSTSFWSGQIPEDQNVNFPWKKIMSHLTWAELKVCRLVHPLWNHMVSQELCARNIFAVRFKIDRKSSKFVQDLEWRVDSSDSKTFQNFLACVSNPMAKFPVTHFEFQGGNLGTDEDVQSFFDLFGQQIRILYIRRVPQGSRCGNKFHPLDFTDKATLRHLLQEQAPNVRKLEIGCFDTEWREDEKIELANVEILTCGYEQNPEIPPKSTAFAMLKGAPRLRKVVNFKADYVQWFVLNDKINTIKEYKFEPYFATEVSLLRLARARPTLKKLVILYHSHQSKFTGEDEEGVKEKNLFLAKFLNTILHSSRHSLVELIMTPLGLFDGAGDKNENILTLPPLPNLVELTLQSTKSETIIVPQNFKMLASFFPPGTDVQSIFPSLKILNLYCTTYYSQRILEYFPKIGNTRQTMGQLDMPTVTTLRFGAYATKEWCQYLAHWLPNVTTIALTAEVRRGWQKVERHVHNVCRHFEDIETLQLLGCDRSLEAKHTIFDAAITGIPKDVCLALNKQANDYTPNIRKVKTKIGITDLQNLRKLDIHISNEKWEDYDPPLEFNLLSRVSKIYAFDLMPQTQVMIGYHQHCPSAEKISGALQSVAGPTVNFVHLNYEECF